MKIFISYDIDIYMINIKRYLNDLCAKKHASATLHCEIASFKKRIAFNQAVRNLKDSGINKSCIITGYKVKVHFPIRLYLVKEENC